MSKWRPVPLNCVYVIGDIHGQLDQLKRICNRILPLRKSDGGKDKLILLGDYIDRGEDSPGVIDFLIKLKKKFGDQIIMLCGNHELLLTKALIQTNDSYNYRMWMENGGNNTLFQYLERAGFEYDNPYAFPRSRIRDVIPQEHLGFIESLKPYYELDDYIFVHGGCNPSEPLCDQNIEEMLWDRILFQFVVSCVKRNQDVPWSKTVVAGHNGRTGRPFVHQKFLMLDVSCERRLLVAELHSMEAYIAAYKKKRLIKYHLSETKVLPIEF